MDVTCAAGSITDEETFLSASKYVDLWTHKLVVLVYIVTVAEYLNGLNFVISYVCRKTLYSELP